MKVESKIHNGGSTKALRLSKAEICKFGPSKVNCISHTYMAINNIEINSK